MAATKTQDVFSRRSAVIDEFKERLSNAVNSKPASSGDIVRGKERLLASIESRLEVTQKARDATVARLDNSIAEIKNRVEGLRAEIESDRQALEGGGGTGGGTGGGGGGPRGGGLVPNPGVGPIVGPIGGIRGPIVGPPVVGPLIPNLNDIRGVGKAYSERLGAAGITTPAQVAKMKPAELAEALGISEKRAQGVVTAAKKVKK